MRRGYASFALLVVLIARDARGQAPLEGTGPLGDAQDRSALMVAGIDRFLLRQIDQAKSERERFWKRDHSTPEAFHRSLERNRARLREILGLRDPKVKGGKLELVAAVGAATTIADADHYKVEAVRWPVFEDVHGEGLLLRPKGKPRALWICLPDADQTPEQLAGLTTGLPATEQIARRLVEGGAAALVPVLIDRRSQFSGNPSIKKMTNQPHREFIYRQAFEVGRTLVGYEVERTLAAIDILARDRESLGASGETPIMIHGYGEGALIALLTSAIAPSRQIASCSLEGYFGPRERLWEEPIYRNLYGYFREFADGEVASMAYPTQIKIFRRDPPAVSGPPAPAPGQSGGAAPGVIKPIAKDAIDAEAARAKTFIKPINGAPTGHEDEWLVVSDSPFSSSLESTTGDAAKVTNPPIDANERMRRQVKELVDHTQTILRRCEDDRGSAWRGVPLDASRWVAKTQSFRKQFWDEVIGRFPAANQPNNAKSRRIYDKPLWTGYEVTLDVWPDVFSWGYLLVPKGIKPGERRPVVVCQHGLEGLPVDTVDESATGFPYYKAFAARLAERGFVVFAPHNPYRGQDKFRTLQRKANTIGRSLFSVILAQHDRLLDWLSGLTFVDPERIGFYGLSYGGKTAMRVPALLDRYCLSICSADFNEWVKKNATVDSPYSYVFTPEYEIFEWDLGHTFNYAEMAFLVAPRPFMVERGHDDGVAPDEWVAYEYAKIRRMYDKLKIGDRTEIEIFDGPHTINGQGTFRFLHKHLKWPEPRSE